MVLVYFFDLTCFHLSFNFYTKITQTWTHWPSHALVSFACSLWYMLIPLFGPFPKWANVFSSFIWPKNIITEKLHWLCGWVLDFNSLSHNHISEEIIAWKISTWELVNYLCCSSVFLMKTGIPLITSYLVSCPIGLCKSTNVAAGILLDSIMHHNFNWNISIFLISPFIYMIK